MAVPTAHTTDEFWEIDAVPLNTYGWNIATFGGGRYDLPPKRGEDIRLAYRNGAIHRPKLADSRTISLVMWTTGVDPQTGNPAGCPPVPGNNDPGARRQWNDNWDFIRRLVWKPQGGQVTLTRRWWLTDPDTGTSSIVVADGLAEIADTMSPTMTGRTRAEFTMTLLMADPFFYGRADAATPNSKIVVPLNPGVAVPVWNPGHDIAAFGDMEVELIGPLTNPAVSNDTAVPQVWVKYYGVIAAGDSVTLKVPTFQARLQGTVTPAGQNVIHKIRHSGARHWFGLLPQTNSLKLTVDAGTGSAQVRFRPPYV